MIRTTLRTHSRSSSTRAGRIRSEATPCSPSTTPTSSDITCGVSWTSIRRSTACGLWRPRSSAPLAAPPLLGPVYINAAVDHSAYDETSVHYEHRFANRDSFQVNYVLSWADGMAGDADGTLRGVPYYLYPVTPSATGGDIFARWEWGPTLYDERHRITAFGVFNLPFKIEVSPTLTFATGRPYTLFQGANPSGEPGALLQITNSAGVPAGIGDARGNDLFMLSARVSRNFFFGSEARYKIAAFGELYNVTDRANFGTSYGDVQGTATYRLPTGYIGGFGAVSTTPNSFQVQFGARVNF